MLDNAGPMTARPDTRPLSLFGFLLSWIYTAWATLVFCVNTFLLICPLILVLPGVTLRRRIGGIGMRLGLIGMGVPFRVQGLAHLPAGPCIVVCNHASYLDGMIMTAALPPRFTFLIQHEVAKWFYAGPVLTRMAYRFINRGNAREGAVQMRALIRDLQQGESLVVFAEGTFVPEPGLLPFKNGAFAMAVKAQLPVVPVGLHGSRGLLRGVAWRFRWSALRVRIGEPIAPGADANVLRDEARRRVLALCGEPDSVALKPDAIDVQAQAA